MRPGRFPQDQPQPARETEYRRYQPDQAQTARVIRAMRYLQMPLDDLRRLVRADEGEAQRICLHGIIDFTVDDVDAAWRRALEAGAAALCEPHDSGEFPRDAPSPIRSATV